MNNTESDISVQYQTSKSEDHRPRRLFNRNFILLWQGQLVSQFGYQVSAIALALWIKHKFDSPSLMCMALMTYSLTFAIMTPIGGVFADKYSRKKILVISDLIHGIIALVLSALLVSPFKDTFFTVGFIFFAQCVFGTGAAFFYPAVTAAIPNLVPKKKLTQANALRMATFQLSMLAGLGLGGLLYEWFGAPFLFCIDGIGYLFSSLSETFISIRQTFNTFSDAKESAFSRFFREMKTGVLFLFRHSGVKNLLLLLSFSYFFIGPFLGLLPYFVEDILRADPKWYGFIQAGFAFGAIMGYALLSAGSFSKKGKGYLVIISFSFLGIIAGFFSHVTNQYLALFMFLLSGIILSILHVTFETIVQLITPDEMRGRVFGVVSTLMSGLLPLGIGFSGIAADLTGRDIPFIFLFSGFCIFIITAVFLYEQSTVRLLTAEP